ncbi:AAA family ATPase [Pleurocapsales cyanobacterium LEGE 06147]|nr:AAA family ATPase [Pleurocapsales cyanobacterium LEGE 06147]
MTIYLQKIYFQNWKCYLAQEIELNLNTDKNIFVFYGQNGAGKTSIQEGILWCLYGSDAVPLEKIAEYFNRVNLKCNPELELSVRLTATFEQDGISQPDVQERIESIIPRACREFFFFDGKKIEEYAKLTHTDETRKAIERTLGVPEIRNLRDDAEGTLKKFEKKIKDAAKNKKELQAVTAELTTLKQEIYTKKGQLQKFREELQQEKKFLEDTELRATQIEDLNNKLKEIEVEQRKKTDWENQFKSLDTEIKQVLTEAPIYMLSELVREVADDIQSKTVSKTRISVSVNLLKELINNNICVCGRCLDNNAYLYIQQQIESLEQVEQISKEAIELQDIYTDLKELSRYQTPDLDKLLLQRDRLIEDIEEVQQVINRKQKETEGFDRQEAKEIWEKIGKLKENIRNQKTRIQRIEKEIESLQQQENQLKRQREQLASQDQLTATLNKQLTMADGLKQAADELIDWYIDNCRQKIEQYTSEIHRRVTNKPDEYIGVQVKQDYTLGIKNVNDDILSPENISAGEKEALAFAFIASLNLASGKAAPLMMDTPFGHLDTTHQKNIVNSLPQIPSQVLVLATDRDLPDYLLQDLRPHVAQIHRIKRLEGSEDASVVEVEE